MLMTARYMAPVSLMLLHRCRIQCHHVSVSTASLTKCARTTSNSTLTGRSCCGAPRPFVSYRNYPAARSLLLVHSFVRSTPFVTWVYLSTAILVRPIMFGELCHAASLHFFKLRRYVTDDCFHSQVVSLVHSTATSSWLDFQRIYSGASSLFLTLRLVWCSD